MTETQTMVKAIPRVACNVYVLAGPSQHGIQKNHGEELKRIYEKATR